MTNRSPGAPNTESRRSRLGLRFLITLALVTFLTIVLILAINQPVAAPGEDTPAGETATAEAAAATVSGDVPAIVFMSNRDGDYDVYAQANGEAAINLTNNDTGDGFPSYSTDTVQISYINQGETELGGYLMNADGSNQTPASADISTFMPILLAGRGDWDRRELPNGDRTIISLRDLNLEVYYQAAGDTAQHNLSHDGAIDWYAQLSADGQQIVFATDRNDGQQDIYLIDVSGEHLTRLTDDPADDWSPLWLSDGSGVMFASERGGRFDGGSLGLYVIRIADSYQSIPTAAEASTLGTLATEPIWQNGWGLYMSNESGNWDIYAIDPDGQTINVTTDPADDLFPTWKPG